ncbi:hypothetical protein SUGI_0740450 [Cryptomeria japonica]|nr:hypothetical protein SUGI_0740450 [Cryptomeria japonica]
MLRSGGIPCVGGSGRMRDWIWGPWEEAVEKIRGCSFPGVVSQVSARPREARERERGPREESCAPLQGMGKPVREASSFSSHSATGSTNNLRELGGSQYAFQKKRHHLLDFSPQP